MPKKKKAIELENKNDEVTLEQQNPNHVICCHVNVHATPNLICILPKGHAGDHFNGSAWSDAAGIPVRKHA